MNITLIRPQVVFIEPTLFQISFWSILKLIILNSLNIATPLELTARLKIQSRKYMLKR